MPTIKNSKTITASGDILGTYDFYGSDGSRQVVAAQIRVVAEADAGIGSGVVPARIELHAQNATGTLTKVDTMSASTAATEGWTTGAGGTVTQQTNKGTEVTLDKPTGEIVMNNASLQSNTTVTFTLISSFITASDIIILVHKLTGASASYNLNAFPKAGEAWISVRNITGAPLAEAIVLGFAVLKSSTS